MQQLAFTIPEILSLVGLAQCVYLVVYISLRAGRLSRAGLPILYFLILGLAFFSDLAEGRISEISQYYFYLQWATWYMGPPLSVLLVVQIAQITKVPPLRDYWVLLLLPAGFVLSLLAISRGDPDCHRFVPCAQFRDLLNVTGLMAGAISLLMIFGKRSLFTGLSRQKYGRERYWLILTLIIVHIVFLSTMLAWLSSYIDLEKAVVLRSFTWLAFVYLVSTSLLRIYPQAVRITPPRNDEAADLNDSEKMLAEKIENLLILDKIYQESSYSRADLARECGASEIVISRVINAHFGKSFPQLMNEHRVEDAKRLLRETQAPVKTIAGDVGFNSLATFNRVFKDITGLAPSQYRSETKK